MAEVPILLSEATLAKLRELAGWAGVSLEHALEQVIDEHYDRLFWHAVDAGYAALRAGSKAWAEIEAELRLWDRTLLDGPGPSERWTEEGDVLPLANEGLVS